MEMGAYLSGNVRGCAMDSLHQCQAVFTNVATARITKAEYCGQKLTDCGSLLFAPYSLLAELFSCQSVVNENRHLRTEVRALVRRGRGEIWGYWGGRH